MGNKLSIFGGNSNIKLLEEICRLLKVKIGNAFVGRFTDGEIQVRLEENVRGDDAFVIQSTCFPAN